jgi:hypothetical protein
LVWSCSVFFSHLKRIHYEFKQFFESEDDDRETNKTSEEDTPSMAPSQATARFYFELTFNLANQDITKHPLIDNSNMYLCLNAAALMKDRIIKEQNELKQHEKKMKSR